MRASPIRSRSGSRSPAWRSGRASARTSSRSLTAPGIPRADSAEQVGEERLLALLLVAVPVGAVRRGLPLAHLGQHLVDHRPQSSGGAGRGVAGAVLLRRRRGVLPALAVV